MMIQRTLKLFLATAAALLAVVASCDWQSDYERALRAASEGDWMTARDAFQGAKSQRAGDSAEATRLPGPVTEPRLWRNGSAYSPEFGAAYSAYRLGLSAADEATKQQYLMLAAAELRGLADKGQAAPETLKALKSVYTLLGDKNGLSEISGMTATWKVDSSFLAPEDMTGPVKSQGGGKQEPNTTTTSGGAKVTTGTNGGQIIKIKPADLGNLAGIYGEDPVPTIETKYALIIGNTNSPNKDSRLAFAGNDAEMVAGALTRYAGYASDHVRVLIDASASTIQAAASELASSLPDNATVVVYFTGYAAYLGGKDYLGGNDLELPKDSTRMVSKSELIRLFSDKGARVYFFAQCNREMDGPDYFGKERLTSGTFSEVYANISGTQANSIFSNGKQVGLYTAAFVATLAEFYTNQVPINEFCWHVFYAMRGGSDANAQRGGGTQTPTLPILVNLGPTSPF